MRYLYLTIIVLLFSSSARTQNLHFTQTQYGTDTVPFGSLFIIKDTIYNSSSATFSGRISLYARLDTTTYSTPPFIDSPFINANLDTTGTPTSSDSFSIRIHVSPPYFTPGANVVVIWPVYQGGAAGPNDSIKLTIIATYPLGIQESPLTSAYLFQTPNYLHINFGEAENLIQQVRIYDILGKQLYDGSPQQSQNILTAGWHRGIYLCEIITQSGQRKTFKVLLN